MKISVISPDEIDAVLVEKWREIQNQNPDLSSPFFSWDFTEVVGRHRPDTRVAVIERDNEVIGFLPFQKHRYGFARPIGLGICDCHGLIVEAGCNIDVPKFFSDAGIQNWPFDHQLATQIWFGEYAEAHFESPVIDTTQGFAEYCSDNRSSDIHRTLKKAQKLERSIGILRFCDNHQNSEALNTVFKLKSQQCKRSGAVDFFALDWVRNVVTDLSEINNHEFSGMTSVLKGDGDFLAVHFGIRTNKVWHWWFPTYNADYKAYSPGIILLLKCIERAQANSIEHIDLGTGDARYKNNLKTGHISLLKGSYFAKPFFRNGSTMLNRMERTFPNGLLTRTSRRIKRTMRYK